ncbi:MAG: hypothetical protein HMLIMOIP_001295 [Candidatus Nitrosomirales archaeon]
MYKTRYGTSSFHLSTDSFSNSFHPFACNPAALAGVFPPSAMKELKLEITAMIAQIQAEVVAASVAK